MLFELQHCTIIILFTNWKYTYSWSIVLIVYCNNTNIYNICIHTLSLSLSPSSTTNFLIARLIIYFLKLFYLLHSYLKRKFKYYVFGKCVCYLFSKGSHIWKKANEWNRSLQARKSWNIRYASIMKHSECM